LSDLIDYRWITSSEANRWLEDFADSEEPLHRVLGRLRKSLSVEKARLVADQLVLRNRAASKFGMLAKQMFFTKLSLQQATDLWIARHKAGRFIREKTVTDFCCGIGGDLIALAERGPVVGWDNSSEMVHLALANLGAIRGSQVSERHAVVRQGKVEHVPPLAGQFWHLDPDRRAGGQRSTHLECHSPGLPTIESWLSTSPDGALKLAPATKVPREWEQEAELEWISRERECRQLVVWFGKLSRHAGKRCATIVRTGSESARSYDSHTFVGDANIVAPQADKVGEFILDTDPAIRAAGLTAALVVETGCELIAPGQSYLTASHRVEHPCLVCLQVQDVLPLRAKTLARHLRSLNLGKLEIKTRGVSTRPETLRKQLKLTGEDSATLLLTRQGEREIAILARRV